MEIWTFVVLGGSYLVMVVFAFSVPLDVLDKYPQAKEFTDFMANWNVQVRRAGETSGYANDVSRFVFSVLWGVMPIYWIVFLLQFVFKNNQRLTFCRDSWGHYLGTLAICFVFLWGALGVPNTPIRPRTGLLLVGELSRSLISPVAVFVAGLLALLIIFLIIMALSGRIVITNGRSGQ